MQSCFTGFGNDLQALDRSAAQGEKVIVDTDFIDTQNLGPDSDQSFFYRVARRYKGFFQLGTQHIWCGERLAVNFAVG